VGRPWQKSHRGHSRLVANFPDAGASGLAVALAVFFFAVLAGQMPAAARGRVPLVEDGPPRQRRREFNHWNICRTFPLRGQSDPACNAGARFVIEYLRSCLRRDGGTRSTAWQHPPNRVERETDSTGGHRSKPRRGRSCDGGGEKDAASTRRGRRTMRRRSCPFARVVGQAGSRFHCGCTRLTLQSPLNRPERGRRGPQKVCVFGKRSRPPRSDRPRFVDKRPRAKAGERHLTDGAKARPCPGGPAASTFRVNTATRHRLSAFRGGVRQSPGDSPRHRPAPALLGPPHSSGPGTENAASYDKYATKIPPHAPFGKRKTLPPERR